MKKNVLLLFSFSLLCACAGNPPQWWNPSGVYGEARPSQTASSAPVQPSLPVSVSAEEEDPYPVEQRIEPVLEEYEELNLSPLGAPQDTGEIAQENTQKDAPQTTASVSETEEARELSLSENEPSPADDALVEEYLPEDGSLPPPSVLQ